MQKAFNDLSFTHERMKSEKEEEIRKLNELLEAQDDVWLAENDHLLDGGESESEFGDETLVNIDVEKSSAEKPAHSISTPHGIKHVGNSQPSPSRPPIIHMLSRTISGSFISNISKQATPAPSDTESESGSQVYLDFSSDDDTFDFDRTFDGSMDETQPAKDTHSTHTPIPSHPLMQLRSPSSTPTPPILDSDRDYKKKIERVVEERDEARHEFQLKVSNYHLFVCSS